MCLFISFIHLDEARIPEGVLDLLKGAPDPEKHGEAWRLLYATDPQLVFHETYHYWQGLRLPFLQWYAVNALRYVLQTFAQLNPMIPDLHEWDVVLPSLHMLSRPWRCQRLRGGSFGIIFDERKRDADVEDEVLLSPLDLLEGAASMAEWQTFGPTPEEVTDPTGFNRWCKRHPSYTSAYRFVARALRDERLALRCFAPMVAAAFETSDPLRAFLSLLSSVFRGRDAEAFRFVESQPEPSNWKGLFNALLDLQKYDAEPDAYPDFEEGLRSRRFFRLNLSAYVDSECYFSSRPHPFLSKATHRWDEFEKSNPEFSWMLSQMAWIGWQTRLDSFDNFQPPLTIWRVDLKGQGYRLLHVPDFNGTLELGQPELVALLTIYSVVRRASGAHFDSDHRLCYHEGCPEYGPNYCNTYPIIPDRFEECGFPARVAQLRGLAKKEKR
jgi:hypothetical protein